MRDDPYGAEFSTTDATRRTRQSLEKILNDTNLIYGDDSYDGEDDYYYGDDTYGYYSDGKDYYYYDNDTSFDLKALEL